MRIKNNSDYRDEPGNGSKIITGADDLPSFQNNDLSLDSAHEVRTVPDASSDLNKKRIIDDSDSENSKPKGPPMRIRTDRGGNSSSGPATERNKS